MEKVTLIPSELCAPVWTKCGQASIQCGSAPLLSIACAHPPPKHTGHLPLRGQERVSSTKTHKWKGFPPSSHTQNVSPGRLVWPVSLITALGDLRLQDGDRSSKYGNWAWPGAREPQTGRAPRPSQPELPSLSLTPFPAQSWLLAFGQRGILRYQTNFCRT